MHRRRVKVSCTDRVTDGEVLQRVKKEKNILHTIKRAGWMGHMLRTNCLLKRVIYGQIEGMLKVTWQR